ncbi:MAG: hypothetical protein J6L66_00415, partial [Anaerotignum sp.]|nr:hypothetical protein [Anaerotignum sp.]
RKGSENEAFSDWNPQAETALFAEENRLSPWKFALQTSPAGCCLQFRSVHRSVCSSVLQLEIPISS